MRVGSAVQYDRYGGFDVVDLVPQERPEPGPGDVVVEVVAAGLNHVERFLREGKLRDHVDLTFPAHQGVDFAGIVRARGKEVRDLKVGDEVMGHAPEGGAHATWIRVPRGAVVKKPEHVGWEVAGGLYLAGATAATIVRGLRLGRRTPWSSRRRRAGSGTSSASSPTTPERPSSPSAARGTTTTCGRSAHSRWPTATARRTASARSPTVARSRLHRQPRWRP